MMVVLNLGFRPFFLLSGLFAVILMALWIPAFTGGRALSSYYGQIGWHSHEMIFGYAAGVIAGFLLTAVRNWTGLPTATGGSLAALVTLWLIARVLPFFSATMPGWLISAVDVAFLPALTASIAVPLVRHAEKRNLLFLPLMLGLFVANLLVHLELLGLVPGVARHGIFLGLYLIILLIVIMGGRVIPFFTERALPSVVIKRRPVLEWLAPWSVIAFMIAEILFPNSKVAGALAGLACIINGIRVVSWYSHRYWQVPLLWVLHLGYGWIVVGFLLKAAASLELIVAQFTIHAFTVGGIGVLTLGMMARVSLGHTARPLKVESSMVIAFALINLAAVLRGLLPSIFPLWFSQLVILSGILWIAAFLMFVIVYAPILTQPRIDGQPG
ncbi:MAG TPA: NnrS family protein [Candidatus Polarisedimenticolaceae bacterium]|nr:NnrS family protein [Candidatus Polarisedimenticolaceae bacterium]